MARKPSLGARYTRLKNIVKKSLVDKGVYDFADDILLDELVYNIKILDDAKADIKKRGYQLNTVRDKTKDPYYQQNPSVNTYLSTVKNVSNVLTKLGITPQERQKLQLSKEVKDPLDELIGKRQPATA